MLPFLSYLLPLFPIPQNTDDQGNPPALYITFLPTNHNFPITYILQPTPRLLSSVGSCPPSSVPSSCRCVVISLPRKSTRAFSPFPGECCNGWMVPPYYLRVAYLPTTYLPTYPQVGLATSGTSGTSGSSGYGACNGSIRQVRQLSPPFFLFFFFLSGTSLHYVNRTVVTT